MSFIAELKRRKVFRVAAAYLVGAWVVLQVASTLFAALELPSWTIKSVAVLTILGFPIAIVLGYIFDLTPGGVERTRGSATHRFPWRAAVVGTVLVSTGVVGFMVMRRRVSAAGIDPNSVVVLPFRVSGDASIAALGEGMVDLIAPKLTGIGGPRAVDSRTTLSAWRRTVASENEDITPGDAIKLARKLKASHVMLGEVIAAPGAIALNARLYSTIDGMAGEAAEVTTTPDSLLSAVDRLVAELLSTQAGHKKRLSALLTASLPAIQAYLDGNRHYRLGGYEEAAKHFGTATDLDSTFALAAYGELRTHGWIDYGPRYQRARRLTLSFRDKLPPRERALVGAYLGDVLLDNRSYRSVVDAWEQVTTQHSDSPEAWFELGDHYFHSGPIIDMEDYEERALKAWSRAIALDSTYAAPWEHQAHVHAARGDTARLRAVYAYLLKLEGEKIRDETAWLYAVSTGNDSMRARLLRMAEGKPLFANAVSVGTVLAAGLPPVGLDTLVGHMLASATTEAERGSTRNFAAAYELNRGRPSQALAHVDPTAQLPENQEVELHALVRNGILYPELMTKRGAEARQKLSNTRNPMIACTAGLWDSLNETSTSVRKMLSLVEDSIEANSVSADIKTCAQMLRAADAVNQRHPRARTELARVDSMIVAGPPIEANTATFSAVVMSRLYAQTGEFERARRAALRRGYTMWGLAAQTLEHARMAAQAGRREEAIRSYRIYLTMRNDPEPGPAKVITDKVRAELAALTSR